MEIFLGIVVIVVLYLWANGRQKRGAQIRGLRYFRTFEVNDDTSYSMTIDLADMKMVDVFAAAGDPDRTREYHVRRDAPFEWRYKESDASWSRERMRLEEQLKDDVLPGTTKNRIEDMGDGPKWTRIANDEIVGPLETQYQRFVQHYSDAE